MMLSRSGVYARRERASALEKTMRTSTQKWKDLWEAIEAMQIGDPPLRWSVPEAELRSVAVYACNHFARSTVRVKTFCCDGQLWIVRLPNRLLEEPQSL